MHHYSFDVLADVRGFDGRSLGGQVHDGKFRALGFGGTQARGEGFGDAHSRDRFNELGDLAIEFGNARLGRRGRLGAFLEPFRQECPDGSLDLRLACRREQIFT
ncbi:hypothetical protein MMB19_14190 [Ralstonia insidiosa]|nr:hypothetical protein MMB19_14190 [Ralstonia insidiosa]